MLPFIFQVFSMEQKTFAFLRSLLIKRFFHLYRCSPLLFKCSRWDVRWKSGVSYKLIHIQRYKSGWICANGLLWASWKWGKMWRNVQTASGLRTLLLNAVFIWHNCNEIFRPPFQKSLSFIWGMRGKFWPACLSQRLNDILLKYDSMNLQDEFNPLLIILYF